ncbi:hypothetical protein [Mariniflexile rhizosphaerae]|uniref:hypothetical protein n=1 Tax=unclassified Mariniflexile TaxID=2643887 RepID=UPI0013C35C3A|nr:hypothetical protein [Mariniflexile sp. TRM1-10]
MLIDIDENTGYTKVWENQPYKCPECNGMTANMGLDFESPKKSDLKAWNHIRNLYETGITFHSCGCSGPGYIPKDKESLIEFLKEKKDIYIKHRRFWSNRIVPKNDSEKSKDWYKNSEYLIYIPNELKDGTNKNRKIDWEKAVVYWSEKIEYIESHLKKL